MDKRRAYERVPIITEVIIYVTEGESLNIDIQPYIIAKAYDISLGGIALTCATFLAHSKGFEQEKILKKDMIVQLLSDYFSLPIKARVAWLNGNNLGCQFIDLEKHIQNELAKQVQELETPNKQEEIGGNYHKAMNDFSIKCSHCGNEILITNIKVNFDVTKTNE